jgi:hypothetical protein
MLLTLLVSTAWRKLMNLPQLLLVLKVLIPELL